MPLYDYRCPICGHEFEAQHKMAEEAPPCEKCGADDAEKVISVPGAIRCVEGNVGKVFFSDRQVESSHGKNWRETAKNPYRPGGDRARQYFG